MDDAEPHLPPDGPPDPAGADPTPAASPRRARRIAWRAERPAEPAAAVPATAPADAALPVPDTSAGPEDLVRADPGSPPVGGDPSVGDPEDVDAVTVKDGGEDAGGDGSEDGRSRRRALAAVRGIAVALAAVSVLGVTAWAVDRPGTLPEDVLDAEGASAFVRLDYDPGVRDLVTAQRFSAAYHESADRLQSRAPLSRGPLGWLVGPMLDGTGLTVGTDVLPWAGDRAGVLLREDGVVLVAVELEGEGAEEAARDFVVRYAAATTTLVGFTVTRGYVVISDSTAVAEDATEDAVTGGALADDPGFAADLARLDSSRLGVVWARLGSRPGPPVEASFSARVRDALDREVGGPAALVRAAVTAGSLPDRVYADIAPTATAEVDGRLVLGLRLRPDRVDVDGHVSGLSVAGQPVGAATADDLPAAPAVAESSTAPTGPTGVFQVRALPADTVLAVGVQGLGGALGALVSPPAGGVTGDPADVAPLDPSTPVAPDPGVVPGAPADPGAGSGDVAAVAPGVAEALPLVGTDTAVGLLGGGGVAVRAAGTDPAAVAGAVAEATSAEPVGVLAEPSAEGTTSLVTTGEVADDTPLDNIPLFADTLPTLDAAVAVVWVNLDWATFTRDVDALAPFSAFGLGVTRGAVPGEFEVHGRLLVDEPVPAPDPSGDPGGESSAAPSGAPSG